MEHIYPLSLVWIRRDLRLVDHHALHQACLYSKQVVVLFVFDRCILDELKDPFDRRVCFIHRTLEEINETLEKQNSRLLVEIGDPTEVVPKVAKKLNAQALFLNGDYEPYAMKRDKKVRQLVEQDGLKTHIYKDHVIFGKNDVLKSDGKPYQVFTPYKNAWLKKLQESDTQEFKVQNNFLPMNLLQSFRSFPQLRELGFKETDFPLSFQKPGRKAALLTLGKFSKKMRDYGDHRDRPALEGTSGLSVHLRFGTVSIRECVRACLPTRTKGAETWLNELIWRDFYQMILSHFPHVQKHAFKSEFDSLKYPGKKSDFEAWTRGETGFPIVDAAMKQLNQTGWMHNRLRMIVASFLVKDLLIDWRKGEKYFAEKLLDFDLASNNGGWQWSASTGCDAQPYFRIFNPWSQSEKFDPEATFIKQFLPELQALPPKVIHNAPQENPIARQYPFPLVEHSTQRQLALDLYKRQKND